MTLTLSCLTSLVLYFSPSLDYHAVSFEVKNEVGNKRENKRNRLYQADVMDTETSYKIN